LRKLREELARFNRQDSGATAPPDARRATAAELQGMMEAASNERSALETKLNTLEQSDRALAARPAEISQIKTEVMSRIAAIEVEMAALAQTDSTELSRVRREMLEAEFAARQAELDALNAEKEPDAQVRAHAAEALGQYAESRVIDNLVKALDDENLAINLATVNSLRTLTGQDFGYDRGAWAAWNKATKEAFAARSVYMYPAFFRDKNWYEYIPFVPGPPNESSSTPAGLQPTAQ
jgi:chromosome segregation ATPase